MAQSNAMSTKRDKVSIQLPLGGHSFSTEGREALRGADVVALLPTPRTTLVPSEALDVADLASHLAAVGLAPRIGQLAVATEAVDGMVAVMAVDETCDAALRTVAHSLVYSSPLNRAVDVKQGVVLSLVEGVLYVRIFNDGLQLAEAMEAVTEADIYYYLEMLNRVYHIYNISAYVAGGSVTLMNVCKRLFNEVKQCEL